MTTKCSSDLWDQAPAVSAAVAATPSGPPPQKRPLLQPSGAPPGASLSEQSLQLQREAPGCPRALPCHCPPGTLVEARAPFLQALFWHEVVSCPHCSELLRGVLAVGPLSAGPLWEVSTHSPSASLWQGAQHAYRAPLSYRKRCVWGAVLQAVNWRGLSSSPAGAELEPALAVGKAERMLACCPLPVSLSRAGILIACTSSACLTPRGHPCCLLQSCRSSPCPCLCKCPSGLTDPAQPWHHSPAPATQPSTATRTSLKRSLTRLPFFLRVFLFGMAFILSF